MTTNSSRPCGSPIRLDEIGARPSNGTVADSFDNALAETTNGLYKAECVYGPDANGWDDVDELELATLSWVHWFNHQRLGGHCNDTPPAEFDSSVLRCPTRRPRRRWNPIARVSIRPRAVQTQGVLPRWEFLPHADDGVGRP